VRISCAFAEPRTPGSHGATRRPEGSGPQPGVAKWFELCGGRSGSRCPWPRKRARQCMLPGLGLVRDLGSVFSTKTETLGASEVLGVKSLHRCCSARCEMRGTKLHSACAVAECGADGPRNKFQSFPQLIRDRPEQLHSRLKVVSDLLRQHVGFRQTVSILQALVLDPEDVEVKLVSPR